MAYCPQCGKPVGLLGVEDTCWDCWDNSAVVADALIVFIALVTGDIPERQGRDRSTQALLDRWENQTNEWNADRRKMAKAEISLIYSGFIEVTIEELVQCFLQSAPSINLKHGVPKAFTMSLEKDEGTSRSQTMPVGPNDKVNIAWEEPQ